MKYEAVTIKDIAKALGLSTSTVSRALRGSYEIDALVAASDKRSTGSLAALARRKVRVPEDMAIVGF
jgi:DNA-binding LacI/PurR family transcriptional regulator